jgi:hypothetical protein
MLFDYAAQPKQLRVLTELPKNLPPSIAFFGQGGRWKSKSESDITDKGKMNM